MRYDIVFKMPSGSQDFFKPVMKTFLAPFASTTNPNPTFPPQMFNGPQLVSLYNVPNVPVSAGRKQVKIAVIVAYTYNGLLADLKTYWQNQINFGPNSTPPTVNVYTMPGATYNTGWAQEECLDVQMVCTINPNASIWVVEAKSDSITDLTAAVNYANQTLKADVVTMSWGMDDAIGFSAYNNYFTNTNTCYCAASGDANNVSWPSVLSNCMSIGGTSLLWTPKSANNRTEFSWTSAGCGYATSVSKPTYQNAVPSIVGNYRAIPDVSLIANQNTGVYSVFRGSWYSFGGTSVSTPIFAAVLSIANQTRFNQGKTGLTTVYTTTPNTATSNNYIPPSNNVQQYLYKTIFPNKNKYQQNFNDIIIGSDAGSVAGNSAILTNYNSGVGYDLPTGLGSPNCSNLCNDLLNI